MRGEVRFAAQRGCTKTEEARAGGPRGGAVLGEPKHAVNWHRSEFREMRFEICYAVHFSVAVHFP